MDLFKIIENIKVSSNKSRIVKPSINVSIPVKQGIVPPKPTNIKTQINKNEIVFTWDICKGATSYKVFLDNVEIGYVPTNYFRTTKELNGNITVLAINSLYQSEFSDPLYIKTIPSQPIQLAVTTNVTSDGYDFEIGFVDNSQIETSYKLVYKIDDTYTYTRNIGAGAGIGQFINYKFSTTSIDNKITLKVIAVNESGENDLANELVLFKLFTPIWTYSIENNQMIINWTHKEPSFTEYILKYSKDGLNYNYLYIPTTGYNANDSITTTIDLLPNEVMNLFLCAKTGSQSHLYSKEIIISKNSDVNIIPPSNFNVRWTGRGIATFTWNDDYQVEDGFEVVYRINEGEEISVLIPSTSIVNTGTKYSYSYDFGGIASSISAKVRMKWKLGVSQFTDSLVTTFYPVSGNPPSYVRRTPSDTKILLEWEAQEYIEKYVIYLICDGKTTTYETVDNYYLLSIDYAIEKQVEIYLKTYFNGGIVSDKTTSMIFTPNSNIYKDISVIYKEIVDKYTLGTVNYQVKFRMENLMNTLNWVSTSNKFILNSKFYTPFTMKYNRLAMTVWGKDVKSENDLVGLMCQNNLLQCDNLMQTISMYNCIDKLNVGTTIITWSLIEYKINTEINKVRIMTLGDSITAGHPNFWAETMTGNEKSQYQYWLNRRLKGAYEIINKGYGSDTTDKMLARFNKDVLSYNAQYCIIQGGTNDLYWAMAEDNGNQQALDRKIQVMKDNISEMVKRCLDNNIIPIVGTLIARTGATGIYQKALYDFNKWIIEFCTGKDNVYYVDFFNSGKETVPPTPLEDPRNAGALNPLYDGEKLPYLNLLNC